MRECKVLAEFKERYVYWSSPTPGAYMANRVIGCGLADLRSFRPPAGTSGWIEGSTTELIVDFEGSHSSDNNVVLHVQVPTR